jgi:hypothetical protein
MDTHLKILLGGVLVGALTAGGGYQLSESSKARVADLAAECKEAHKREVKTKAEPWKGDPLVCSPTELRMSSRSSPNVGIQAAIVSSQKESEDRLKYGLVIASLVVLVAGIPYAWYFLLRRIRELRDAIVGK